MSTAKFDTLSNLAGTQTVPVATVAQGSAKAWVNFNGTGTAAIRASFNVSSITDNGTGNYTVNFNNAMPDANYSVVSSAGTTSSLSGVYIACGEENAQAPTTTAYRVRTVNDNIYTDLGYVYVAIFR